MLLGEALSGVSVQYFSLGRLRSNYTRAMKEVEMMELIMIVVVILAAETRAVTILEVATSDPLRI